MQDHRHCLSCGKMITTKEAFCSEKCMQEFKEAHQRAARFSKIWTIVLIAAICALIVVTLIR